jgi:hypothetical protein
LARAIDVDGVPVLEPEFVIYMKLVAGRRQDLADIEAMLRAGFADIARARSVIGALGAKEQAAFEQIAASLND